MVCNWQCSQHLKELLDKICVAVEQKPLQHPDRMNLPESLRREKDCHQTNTKHYACKKMGVEITEAL